MRSLTIIMIILLVTLQYKLWFAKGGVPDILRLKKQYQVEVAKNNRLKKRNQILLQDIKQLKSGAAAIEGKARNELGMIKQGEVFYRLISPEKSKSDT